MWYNIIKRKLAVTSLNACNDKITTYDYFVGNNMPDYIRELLKKIRKQPALYIGKKSLDRLSHFLSGYVCCIYEQQGIVVQPLPGFQEYISKEFAIQSAHGWSDILLFFSSGEEEAFDKFYIYLDRFYGEGWDT